MLIPDARMFYEGQHLFFRRFCVLHLEFWCVGCHKFLSRLFSFCSCFVLCSWLYDIFLVHEVLFFVLAERVISRGLHDERRCCIRRFVSSCHRSGVSAVSRMLVKSSLPTSLAATYTHTRDLSQIEVEQTSVISIFLSGAMKRPRLFEGRRAS